MCSANVDRNFFAALIIAIRLFYKVQRLRSAMRVAIAYAAFATK
jgi:hypothetical protein